MPWNDLLTPLWRIAGRLVAAALLGAVLAGCATVPSAPSGARRDALGDFSLEGRFSLRHEDTNYAGRLSWRHAGVDNELLLASPFGQGLAQITTSARGAQLTMSDGKVYAAADSEELTRQVLGYPLPLAQLTDWVRGRGVASGLAELVELDGQGRPLRLRQDDWRIAYEYDSDAAQALPSRLFAQRDDGLELRLRIDDWNASAALPPAEGSP